MQEGDRVSVCPFSRRLVDEPNASPFQARKFGADVVDAIGHVVQFARRVAAELLDRRIRRERSHEFDDGPTGRDADDLDALLLDGFAIEPAEAEGFGIDPLRRVEVADDDADMVDRRPLQSTMFCASCARRQARVPLAQATTSVAA
jgi:hypothetical protein